MLLGEVLDLKKIKQWPQRFMTIHGFPSLLQDVQHNNELSWFLLAFKQISMHNFI
jgi:hypothetical protein